MSRATGRNFVAASAPAAALVAVAAAAAWAAGAVEQAKLTAAAAAPAEHAGTAVAVSGDTVLVAAPDARDANGVAVGAVRVFTRASGTWTEQAKLAPAPAGGGMGPAVAVWGDTAVVGSSSGPARVFARAGGVWTEQATLPGTSSVAVALFDDTAVVGTGSGSARVFSRTGGTWTEQATLSAADVVPGAGFGDTVAVSLDTVAVGAAGDDDGGTDAGAAYVFTRTAGAWTFEAKLTAPDAAPGDRFGRAVALTGDTLVVGAPGDTHAGGAAAGSAYVFARAGGAWTPQGKLTAPDAAPADAYGDSVALSLSGNIAVVGAPHAAGGRGAAYLVTRTLGVWTHGDRIVASDAAVSDGFGQSVATAGDTVVVGSPGAAGGGGAQAGAAYAFVGLPVPLAAPTPGTIETVAGGGSDDGAAAVASLLHHPAGVAYDAAGNLLVADTENHRIRLVDAATGTIRTIAGLGGAGFSGDGGPATAAALRGPAGLAVDSHGNVLVADAGNHRIRRIDAAGVITTIAGDGVARLAGDGAAATSASLSRPTGVAVDGAGDVFVADTGNHCVRRIDAATGVIATLAGDGTAGFAGDGGPATAARLDGPEAVAVDAAGGVLVSDTNNYRVRRIDTASGTVTTIVGNGTASWAGDGLPATQAAMGRPIGLALDAAGNLYIADSNNHRIRRVDGATGVITTANEGGSWTFVGDGTTSTAVSLAWPSGLVLDASGALVIADTFNDSVKRIDALTSATTTLAGTGSWESAGDGGPATAATVALPADVAVDGFGNLFVTDHLDNRIRRVDAVTGLVSTAAGGGALGVVGDGGPATAAALRGPNGLAVDAAGNVWFADSLDDRVRFVSTVTAAIGTVAGTGSAGFSGDGGAASAAALAFPADVALDALRNLAVADANNRRVRQADAATGVISTIAGNGSKTPSGDDGPAVAAGLAGALAVARDAAGNLYVLDGADCRVRRVDAVTGTITSYAGNGTRGYAGDGGPATSASLDIVGGGIALDTAGDLYIADGGNHRVRVVDAATGIITTIAGNGTPSFGGDGGPAANAGLNGPCGVTVGRNGDVYVADAGNRRVRRISALRPPAALAIDGAPLTDWTVGFAYGTRTFTVSGGSDPVAWTVVGLPPGLAATATGRTLQVGGTPSSAGAFTVVVTVRDATGSAVVHSFTLTVGTLLTPPSGPLPEGTQGRSYGTRRIVTTGGTEPIAWTATGLPPGLAATGAARALRITGTPTAPGTYSVVATATDFLGSSATQTFAVVIRPSVAPSGPAEEVEREYVVSIPLEPRDLQQQPWTLAVASRPGAGDSITIDAQSADLLTISGTIDFGGGGGTYRFANQRMTRRTGPGPATGLALDVTATDVTDARFGVRVIASLEDRRFTGTFLYLTRALTWSWLGSAAAFSAPDALRTTCAIDTSGADFLSAEGSVSALRLPGPSGGMVGVGTLRVPVGTPDADGLPRRVPVTLSVVPGRGLVVDGRAAAGTGTVHRFHAESAAWDTVSASADPTLLLGRGDAWTAQASVAQIVAGVETATTARIGRGTDLRFDARPRTSVAVLCVSGHPGLAYDAAAQAFVDGGAAIGSYLQGDEAHGGPGPVLADAVAAAGGGRTAEVTYFSDAAGTTDCGGFDALVAKLRRLRDDWPTTRVVVVAHGHGGVWAHAALLREVTDVPVFALVDLDATSGGWDLHGTADRDRLGVDPRLAVVAGGAARDLTDVVPGGVAHALEVRVQFDVAQNVALSPATELSGAASHEDHASVWHADGDAVPQAAAWLRARVAADADVQPTSPRWVVDAWGTVVRSLADATTPWDGLDDGGAHVVDGAYYVVTRQTGGGAATLATTRVVIDHADPTVSVAAPVSVTSRPSIRVRGTAADDIGVATVSWTTDAGASGTAAGTSSWIATVPLHAGANSVTFTATDGAGNSAAATVAVEYRPALLTLAPGYNLVGLPSAPGAGFGASALLATINGGGGNASAVVDASGADSRTRLATGAGADFEIVPGHAYFVLSATAAGVVVPGDALPTAPAQVTLRAGLNYVALPVAAGAPRKASAVAAEIAAQGGHVTAICQWKDGAPVPFVPGRSVNDFDVVVGRGFIVVAGADSVWEVGP